MFSSTRVATAVRRAANAVPQRSLYLGQTVAEQVKVAEHASKTLGTYRMLSLFVAIPACGVIAYKSLVAAEHPHPPEFVAYPHLRKHAKKFPWGDGNHVLFFNAHVNPLPDGYVSEEH